MHITGSSDATHHTTGVRIKGLPVTSEKLLKAMKKENPPSPRKE
jgi:hypothetical protein